MIKFPERLLCARASHLIFKATPQSITVSLHHVFMYTSLMTSKLPPCHTDKASEAWRDDTSHSRAGREQQSWGSRSKPVRAECPQSCPFHQAMLPDSAPSKPTAGPSPGPGSPSPNPRRCPIRRGCAPAPPPQEGPLGVLAIQGHVRAYPRQIFRQLHCGAGVGGGASGRDQGALLCASSASQPHPRPGHPVGRWYRLEAATPTTTHNTSHESSLDSQEANPQPLVPRAEPAQ